MKEDEISEIRSFHFGMLANRIPVSGSRVKLSSPVHFSGYFPDFASTDVLLMVFHFPSVIFPEVFIFSFSISSSEVASPRVSLITPEGLGAYRHLPSLSLPGVLKLEDSRNLQLEVDVVRSLRSAAMAHTYLICPL